jgi:hypothetical protein
MDRMVILIHILQQLEQQQTQMLIFGLGIEDPKLLRE